MNKYTVNQAKEEIKNSIKVYLMKNDDGSYIMDEVNRIPFFLYGAPGVGKTQMTEQIANELNIGFVSLSITHHTRNTVLGLPVIEENGSIRNTEYTMSEIVAMVQKKYNEGYTEGILLIDEFASMAESLVAPMLAFLQTKNIGNYHLPEGWVLILCSNPPEYNKTARKFDPAIMDRVRIMDIQANSTELIEYGKQKDFHSSIIEYLIMNPLDIQILNTTEDGNKMIVTGRSWENLSHCLNGYEKLDLSVTQELIRQFIKSDEVARKFFLYYESQRYGLDLKEINEVLKGKNMAKHIFKFENRSYKSRFQAMFMICARLVADAKDFEGSTAMPFDTEAFKGSDKNAENISDDPEVCETMKKAKNLNKEIKYACLFIEAIEKDKDLRSIFINKINSCRGIVRVLCRFKNKEYQSLASDVVGIDTYLKQTAELVDVDGNDRKAV